jgi:hypothetical protein
MRWKTWASSCAAAGATLGQGGAHAVACHEDPDIVGYEKSTSVGFTFGVAFGGGWRVVYGIDVRMTSGNQSAALVRLEGHGVSQARLVLAGHFISESAVGAEVGLALHSGRRDTDVDSALALHLAGGPYDGGGGLQAQAGIPFIGDLRNWEGSAAVVLVPNEWKLCLGGSGRCLRDGEESVLPAVATLGGEDAAANAWIEDARAEYASVWAFQRMARELATAGAPAALVRAARNAAEDEARHTELCARMAGRPFWLLPLDDTYAEARWAAGSREARPTLGREAWIDGCIGEGIAAAQAASAGAMSGGAEAEVQRAIAADERRHAELAWAILEWTWREGGGRARDAIAEAAAIEPPITATDRPDRDPDAARLAAEREVGEALARIRTLVG